MIWNLRSYKRMHDSGGDVRIIIANRSVAGKEIPAVEVYFLSSHRPRIKIHLANRIEMVA